MRTSIKYLLLGAGFGGIFPFIATLVWLGSRDIQIGWGSFWEAQATESLMWVIDSAPFFLGIFAWMAGVRQERLEEFGREASNDLEQLFRISQDMFCTCSLNGTILRCNPALEKTLGQSPGALIGKSIYDLVQEEDREKMRALLQDALKSEQDVRFENRLLTDGPEPLYVEWSISMPLEDKFLASGRNVSLKKKQKEELTRKTKSLERSLDELDKFAYVVSHDLKSPLRGIYSLADFIAEDLAEGDALAVEKHLELLRRRVNRMQNLILGVLEYSRAGKDLDLRTPVYLPSHLAETVADMDLPENFSVNYPDQLPTVNFNASKLTQIFRNLISNAARFNNKAQAWVEIDCEEQPEQWVFSVKDNGPGIPARFHEQVFSMFRTLQSRDDLESTGIGLPIVKKILEEAGGSIRVDRNYQDGTCIVFAIPRA